MALLAEGISAVLREEVADLGDGAIFCRLMVRLGMAVALGAALGLEREKAHQSAGLRTHILVSLGAALLAATPHVAGMGAEATSRVIQGLVAGIGFLGGGAILKLTDEHQVRGLTTAAGIWLAAAVGVAAGLGRPMAAVLGTALGYLVLNLVGWLEARAEQRHL